MHSPTLSVPAIPRHACVLQSWNVAAICGCPEQSPPEPLMTQFSAAAVSWRANCKIWSPRGLTHIASSAEAASFSRSEERRVGKEGRDREGPAADGTPSRQWHLVERKR